MSRITVDELGRLMHGGKEILILDVRTPDVRAVEGIIPGAVPVHPAEINTVIGYSGERETIVYCACPREASAATVAKTPAACELQEDTPSSRWNRCMGQGGAPCRASPMPTRVSASMMRPAEALDAARSNLPASLELDETRCPYQMEVSLISCWSVAG